MIKARMSSFKRNSEVNPKKQRKGNNTEEKTMERMNKATSLSSGETDHSKRGEHR